jgi:hypothetical protein
VSGRLPSIVIIVVVVIIVVIVIVIVIAEDAAEIGFFANDHDDGLRAGANNAFFLEAYDRVFDLVHQATFAAPQTADGTSAVFAEVNDAKLRNRACVRGGGFFRTARGPFRGVTGSHVALSWI